MATNYEVEAFDLDAVEFVAGMCLSAQVQEDIFRLEPGQYLDFVSESSGYALRLRRILGGYVVRGTVRGS